MLARSSGSRFTAPISSSICPIILWEPGAVFWRSSAACNWVSVISPLFTRNSPKRGRYLSASYGSHTSCRPANNISRAACPTATARFTPQTGQRMLAKEIGEWQRGQVKDGSDGDDSGDVIAHSLISHMIQPIVVPIVRRTYGTPVSYYARQSRRPPRVLLVLKWIGRRSGRSLQGIWGRAFDS